jgi:hypothetical protein
MAIISAKLSRAATIWFLVSALANTPIAMSIAPTFSAKKSPSDAPRAAASKAFLITAPTS